MDSSIERKLGWIIGLRRFKRCLRGVDARDEMISERNIILFIFKLLRIVLIMKKFFKSYYMIVFLIYIFLLHEV